VIPTTGPAPAVGTTPGTANRHIRAVVLDWAGTTQDHGSVAPVAALVEVFRRRGVEVSPATARVGMGRHKREHLASLLFESGVARAWSTAMGAAPTGADIDGLFAAFLPIQAEMIRRHGGLITGTLEAIRALRDRGIAIGSTSGYTAELMAVAAAEAAAAGYMPDVIVCADEVPAARPEPWMLLRAMERLRVYPPSAVVKAGDTPLDIAEGLNAGAWTIGIARSGSLVGRTEQELALLSDVEVTDLVAGARRILLDSGAHLVIDTVAGLVQAVEWIGSRLAAGERP
jgi:phosphonoacetaldehyde hydrolase